MSALTKISEKYKKLIMKVLLLLALAGIQPFLWNFVSSTAARVHEVRSQEQQAAELTKRVETIKKENETQRELLNQLEVVVPKKEALPQVVERLEQLAAEQRLTVEVSNIEQIKESDDKAEVSAIAPVQVTVSTTGAAPQLLAYISAVEHVQEFTSIKKWTLNSNVASEPTSLPPTAGTPTNPSYTLTMTVLFFLQSSPNANAS